MEVLIIGAGPAGLTAAYELSQQGIDCTILEADNVVGGISRTACHKGYRFDLGGHRFFSKVPFVNKLWLDVMGGDFLLRPRMSRIHYRGHFYDYPLKVGNAFAGLGALEAVLLSLSYAKARLFPRRRAVGVSARSLPYGYSYPKQDYRQTIEFVVQNRQGQERVAAVGKTAAIPVLDYFDKPWQRVDTVDQLRQLRAEGHGVWVLFTFPAYIKADTPEIWETLQNDCEEISKFHGTIAGGDIHVHRCPPLP